MQVVSEPGPSRLPEGVGDEPRSPEKRSRTPKSKKTDSFTTGADFISFGGPENHERANGARQNGFTREWDRGKRDRDWDRDDRDRGRDRKGKKRKLDESEETTTRGRTGGPMDIQSSKVKLRKAPWLAHVNWDNCRNAAQLLHEEVNAFQNYILPTPVEHEVRCMVVQLITCSVRKAYPDAVVLPFGSFGTKLYLPQGDIDLVVNSKALASKDRVGSLRSLANIVRKTGITDKVTVIAKAKVPIVKFVTSYGHFAVDISINQANGVKAGEMINRFLEEFPALRALVLIVKAFLNQRGMNEVYSGGLGSYSIVCLSVSFLQMHPKLRRAEIDASRNLGVLIMEFFELYGFYFNYSETGISLHHGGSYFNKAERGWLDYSRKYLLSIEDPGDITNDISRGSFGIKQVRQTFAGAFEIMKAAAYVHAGILTARREKYYVDLRRGRDRRNNHGRAEDMEENSILLSILGINQETINRRRLVQEVYETGSLARLLGVDPSASRHLSSPDQRQVLGSPNTKRRSLEAVESVAAAWGEADMVLSTSDEELERRSHNERIHISDESEEGSRYNIARNRPARKRRKTGDRRHDLRTTVFVSDSDKETHDEDQEEDELSPEENTSRYPREFVANGASAREPLVINLLGDSGDDEIREIERKYTAADQRREMERKEMEAAASKGRTKNASQRQLSSGLRQSYWASKATRGGGFSDSELD